MNEDRSKKRWKSCLAVLLSISLALSAAMFQGSEADAGEQDPAAISANALTSSHVYYNLNGQNYRTWASPVYNYLTKTADGYMRVSADVDGQTYVEYYDSAFQLTSQKELQAELPLFGGFFAGSDAYYLVYGQSNRKENDNTEVFRIVKYDKNWNRVAAAALRGANTTVPFDAGSLRMAEGGGYLYIRTCHEMYTSSDGNNHQANVMIQVDESSMKVVDSFTDVMNVSVGYVSHSFNQFILVDDDSNLVGLDHGDAYPRSVVLGIYGSRAGQSSFSGSYHYSDLFRFAGNTGKNYTGASVGGFEYSGTHYLTAMTSIDQNAFGSDSNPGNVYVLATDRGNISSTKTIKITDYSPSGNISASTPQLVKMDSNSFLLLWAEMDDWYDPISLKYTWLNGAGQQTGKVYTAKGYLSDCQPIAAGEKVVWYSMDDRHLTFYSIDRNGKFKAENAYSLASDTITVSLARTSYAYNGKSRKPSVVVTDGDDTLEKGMDYTVSYKNNREIGKASVVITGKGAYSGSVTKTFKIVPAKVTLSGVKNNAKRKVTVTWKKNPQASGYQIQYRTGKTKKTVTVKGASAVKTTIKGLKKGNTYMIRIRAYSTVSGQNYYSEWSSQKRVVIRK